MGKIGLWSKITCIAQSNEAATVTKQRAKCCPKTHKKCIPPECIAQQQQPFMRGAMRQHTQKTGILYCVCWVARSGAIFMKQQAVLFFVSTLGHRTFSHTRGSGNT